MILYHLKILQKYCNFTKNDLVNIKINEKKYIKYKMNELKKKSFLNIINKSKIQTKKKTKHNNLSNILD